MLTEIDPVWINCALVLLCVVAGLLVVLINLQRMRSAEVETALRVCLKTLSNPTHQVFAGLFTLVIVGYTIGWHFFFIQPNAAEILPPPLANSEVIATESVPSVVYSESLSNANYQVGSRLPDTEAPGGYSESTNYPRSNLLRFRQSEIGLLLIADDIRQDEVHLNLVNTTKEVVSFEAQDSRLNLVQEALDEAGRWRPVEVFSDSTCGNSDHRVKLPGKYHWRIIAPRYAGSFKTRIRFRMIKPELVSNEFEGSVEPSQFLPPANGSMPIVSAGEFGMADMKAWKPGSRNVDQQVESIQTIEPLSVATFSVEAWLVQVNGELYGRKWLRYFDGYRELSSPVIAYPVMPNLKEFIGGIALLAEPDIRHKDKMHLQFANLSDNNVLMPTSKGCIAIYCEAKNEQGQWKAIERVQNPPAEGLDYGCVLRPRDGWQFWVNRYDGPYKTMLRFRVRGLGLVSNEFPGGIHPGQLIE